MIVTVPSKFRLHGSGEVTVVLVTIVLATIVWPRIVVVPVIVRIVWIVVRIPIREPEPKEEAVTKETVVVVMKETIVVTMKEMIVVTMKGEIV